MSTSPPTRVASGAVNPARKLTSIIGGMLTGADSIDDIDIIRAGGTPILFDHVYAPSTLGIFLRGFTYGHTLQLGAVLRRHLIGLAARTPMLPGIEDRAFLDIDRLLRPVYRHQKQGASYGHAKIVGRALLRKGPVAAGDPSARSPDCSCAAPTMAGLWGAPPRIRRFLLTRRVAGIEGLRRDRPGGDGYAAGPPRRVHAHGRGPGDLRPYLARRNHRYTPVARPCGRGPDAERTGITCRTGTPGADYYAVAPPGKATW
jgi:hypothetical protein